MLESNVNSLLWYIRHDIYIKRIGFSLIRVYRFQTQREAVSTDNVLLSQLKWPIEYMFVALRPAYNISSANPNQYRDWDRFTLLTDQIADVAQKGYSQVVIDDTVAWNAGTGKTKQAFSQVTGDHITFTNSLETIDTLQLQAHGINIYQVYKSAFFRDYQSFTFGGVNIVTPEDRGALMMNFCLYPGTYQPSGHINVSRAREFYLQFVSSYCGSATQCDLLVLAIALNFLLISDGSAVLRLIYRREKVIACHIRQDKHKPSGNTSYKDVLTAKLPNCGKLLRVYTTVYSYSCRHQGNDLGYGKNVYIWTIRIEVYVVIDSVKTFRGRMVIGALSTRLTSCLSYGPSPPKGWIYCRDRYLSRDKSYSLNIESRTVPKQKVSYYEKSKNNQISINRFHKANNFFL